MDEHTHLRLQALHRRVQQLEDDLRRCMSTSDATGRRRACARGSDETGDRASRFGRLRFVLLRDNAPLERSAVGSRCVRWGVATSPV